MSMGGVQFKDHASTEAWVKLLEVNDTVQCIDMAFDMNVHLLALSTDLSTTTQVTKARAEAIKANFASVQEAVTTSSFSLPFIETIFRPSNNSDDAAKGGLRFAAALESSATFVGNMEYSVLENWKTKLERNYSRNQRSIDTEFPRSQAKHARANAVFTAINREGYLQAIGFIESLSPFSKMMTEAGLDEVEAWK